MCVYIYTYIKNPKQIKKKKPLKKLRESGKKKKNEKSEVKLVEIQCCTVPKKKIELYTIIENKEEKDQKKKVEELKNVAGTFLFK